MALAVWQRGPICVPGRANAAAAAPALAPLLLLPRRRVRVGVAAAANVQRRLAVTMQATSASSAQGSLPEDEEANEHGATGAAAAAAGSASKASVWRTLLARAPGAVAAGACLALFAAAHGTRAATVPSAAASSSASSSVARVNPRTTAAKAAAAAAAAAATAANARAAPAAAAPATPPAAATAGAASLSLTLPSAAPALPALPGAGGARDAAAALHYRLMQLFALPTVGKLLAVAAVAAPVVVLGGAAYRFATGAPWGAAMARAYHAMSNLPGTDLVNDGGPEGGAESRATHVINNIVYLAGVLGFAAVLGIIADDIASAVQELRGGNGPVAESGHAVVLGWNAATIPTLRQMSVARAQARGPPHARPFGPQGVVVVLADRPKAEMDEDVRAALYDGGNGGGLKVVTRSGPPARLEGLRRAAVAAAATVIVQYPETAGGADAAAAELAATLAALKREGGPHGQRVVVQGGGAAAGGSAKHGAAAPKAAPAKPGALEPEPTVAALEALRGGGGVGPGAAAAEIVAAGGGGGGARVQQLMAQTALQPGLEFVLGDLFEFEEAEGAHHAGAEFFMAPVPHDLAGQPYREVRRAYRSGIVLGFFEPSAAGAGTAAAAASGALRLNPRDNAIVPPGARLVFVTSGQRVERCGAGSAPETALPRLRRARAMAARRRHIAVLDFDGHGARRMLDALAEFCPRGSHVTLVTSDPAAKEALRPLQRRGVKADVVAGNPASGATLRAARLERAHAAVIVSGLDGGGGGGDSNSSGSGGDAAAAAADARAVATVLQLQAISAAHLESGKRASPLGVVAAVRSTSTEEVLWHATLSHEAEAAAAAVAAGRRDLADLPAALSLHLLNPDELAAGMVTQAAIEPRLNRVFTELLADARGHEIYLKRASCFGLPPPGRPTATLRWSQVQEAVRARGATAIGLAPRVGGPDAIELAPPADAMVEVAEGDELVVVAAD